jgi:hypothetical protein
MCLSLDLISINQPAAMAPGSSFSPKPHAYKMTSRLKNFYYRLTPTPSSTTVPTVSFSKAPSAPDLFPATNPSSDGDECLHDCSSCSVKYPSNFTIDENEELYGHVKGWATHLIVATGKSDWVRNVAGTYTLCCTMRMTYRQADQLQTKRAASWRRLTRAM